MKSSEIRRAFLDYFTRNGHQECDSSSLVPSDDPTLLFTNAGMNQFKDVFLGKEQRPYTRAATSQKCVRAGGKHNDLENVGYTARHHTFFEMLGNFSFGDYFKEDAIRFAWEFLTVDMKLPPEKLWVTVYKDDQEAEDIWFNDIGIDQSRFSRLGKKDNFWAMGDTGPCGPCSEIFYDHGEWVPGDPPGGPNDDGDRFIEIWNLVFMQYNRTADGELHPLPKPSVDTGMGLERISAVMQNVHSNYEIDLFQSILEGASRLLGGVETTEQSLRVIADHIRACSFLISDGVMPSNEGRGFVLRRIVRRAVRHGNKLGATEPFFYKLVSVLADVMGDAYPDLIGRKAEIERVLLLEEEQFARTLDKGMKLLLQDIQDIGNLKGKVIPGHTVFTLYDTYGFPVDLTNDVAREHGLELDYEGYEKEMEAQRERARSASKFDVDYSNAIVVDGETLFTGYDHLAEQGDVVKAVFVDGKPGCAKSGDQAVVVLEETPFYAESGGQVGDQGVIVWADGEFLVQDTQKEGGNHLHIGKVLKGEIAEGIEVSAAVDSAKRQATALNHSATHLLHAALRQVLGSHVVQKGSLVDHEKLRFDFAHPEAVTVEQIEQIESIVNRQIRANTEITTLITDIETARKKGAMALFGEKYGDEVRVLSMGESDFSVELCGGTHANRTGDIGSLIVTSEGGISSGVRRIEAVTGALAEDRRRTDAGMLKSMAALLKTGREGVVDKLHQTVDRMKMLERELDRLKSKLASSAGNDLAGQAVDVNGVKVLAARLDGVDRKALMDTVDQLKNRLGSGVVLLSAAEDGKVILVAGVTRDICKKVKAGELIKETASRLGGKGGGRPDMAQGGGSDIAGIPAMLEMVPEWVQSRL
ncbi:MAG: alanine--tRNA ligase [Gammaproteobacteria bacterium]|nr:MAG: alanine--tRNA ligase [Pseudomonadota bacterium]PIE38135.1 MAG: alanine--tRNA ligase [Gammaproteobacteria bacterium]